MDEDAMLAQLLDETESGIQSARAEATYTMSGTDHSSSSDPSMVSVPTREAIEKLDKLDPLEKFLVLSAE